VKTAIGNDRLAHHAVSPRVGLGAAATERERIGALLRDRGKPVVEISAVAPMDAADSSISRSEANADEVDVRRPSGDCPMCSMPSASATSIAPKRDLTCSGGDGGEGAGAHPVDREACLERSRGSGEESATSRRASAPGRRPARSPRGRRRRPIRSGGISGIAPQELANGLDTHVVGARAASTGPSDRALCRTAFARRRRRRPRGLRASRFTILRPWSGRSGQTRRSSATRAGETRGLDQRQLTQLGNAAWAAGLSLLMSGRTTRTRRRKWLRRAAQRTATAGTAPRQLLRGVGRSRQ